MSEKQKPTWEIKMNVDGLTVISVRTNERAAERVAQAFGMDIKDSNYAAHWPIVISKIGARVKLEQEAMTQLLAPKLAVKQGEIMIILTGRTRPGEGEVASDNDEFMDLEKAIKKIYDETENLPSMKWAVAVAGGGTVIARDNE